jgi:hypothetical protein
MVRNMKLGFNRNTKHSEFKPSVQYKEQGKLAFVNTHDPAILMSETYAQRTPNTKKETKQKASSDFSSFFKSFKSDSEKKTA